MENKSDDLVIREEPLFKMVELGNYSIRDDIYKEALSVLKDNNTVVHNGVTFELFWGIKKDILKKITGKDQNDFEFVPGIFTKKGKCFINIYSRDFDCDAIMVKLCNYVQQIKKSLDNKHGLNLDI